MGNLASVFNGSTFNFNFGGCFSSKEDIVNDKLDELMYSLVQLQTSNTILPYKSLLSLLLLRVMAEYGATEGQIIRANGEVIASIGITHKEIIVTEISFQIRKLNKIIAYMQLNNSKKNIPLLLGERLSIFEDIISEMKY